MRLSIVSYLDPQASAQVRDLQYAISDITRSRASLLSWGPHVTLADGVEAEDDQIVKGLSFCAILASVPGHLVVQGRKAWGGARGILDFSRI